MGDGYSQDSVPYVLSAYYEHVLNINVKDLHIAYLMAPGKTLIAAQVIWSAQGHTAELHSTLRSIHSVGPPIKWNPDYL